MQLDGQKFSPQSIRVWHTFLLLNGIFGFAYGLYLSYAYIYLSKQLERLNLQSVGSSAPVYNVFDNILLVLALSMFFEAWAEPATGDYADVRGRRRATVVAFLGMAVAFILYWLSSVTASIPPDMNPRGLVTTIIAVSAELSASLALAFFSGALEAWFVDELHVTGVSAKADLQPCFSVKTQVMGGAMVAGGTLSLLLGKTALATPQPDLTIGSIASLPWPLAAGLMSLAALFALVSMVETETHGVINRPAFQPTRIFYRIAELGQRREMMLILLVSSLLYACQVSFAQVLGVVLTDQYLAQRAENSIVNWLQAHYWVYWLVLGSSRMIGPYLSNVRRGRLSPNRAVTFGYWGKLNCLFIALGAIGVLLGVLTPMRIGIFLAWPLFVVAKIFEEAFKPVRETYLNELILDRTNRAFTLSMSIPFGSLLVALVIISLLTTRALVPGIYDQIAVSSIGISWLLLIEGLVGVCAVVLAIRRIEDPLLSTEAEGTLEGVKYD